jgi:hypothetical protein
MRLARSRTRFDSKNYIEFVHWDLDACASPDMIAFQPPNSPVGVGGPHGYRKTPNPHKA